MKGVLDEQLIIVRTEISRSVHNLLELARQIGHDELVATIQDLADRIDDPFMFVIVGEVKAGKSSFINALLETETDICKVAPSPMTDTIQQITYGEPAREEIINTYLKRLYQPVDILKDIAIVDTPGTNTIIDHHQEITERFIPGADLIIFVFEAKNPYRQSAWEFFDFIHADWRKKIIFILQQKDLMEADDLAVNIEGVRRHAREKGIDDPLVFAVSAKQEQAGEKDESGYNPLRAYIQESVTGGKAPVLKLESNVNTALSVSRKIEEGLAVRREQWEVDKAFREDIDETLEKQTQICRDQVDLLVENLLAGYDKTMWEKTEELSGVLSFGSVLKRSFASIFTKNPSVKEWLTGFATEMEEELNASLRQKLNDRVLDLAESIQQMGQIIDLKIRSSKTILKDDHEIFSDIAEKRSRILTELQQTFVEFLNKADNFKDETIFTQKDKMSPHLATGGGIAVVGVILTVLTNGMVFDITGGVLTAIGFLFAGVSLGLQKRKILSKFKEEIKIGRSKLEEDVTDRLKQYVVFVRTQIEKNFGEFDLLLATEEGELKNLSNKQADIVQGLQKLESDLNKMMAG